ncbi:MAG: enoyl-CoA hydratase/isomerase family protein [Porticoccaceae bacterium]
MTFKTLKFEILENIGILSINRPEALNALNHEVIAELATFCGQAETLGIRCLIITGEGKAFVAGADIKAMAKLPDDQGFELVRAGQQVFRSVQALPFPVIAAVNGFALGGGFELALACDYIIASNKAKFGLPEVTLGLIPGYGGTQRLTRLTGKAIASRVTLSGNIFDAQQALNWGLVTELCEPDALLDTCIAEARVIATRSRTALALVKRAISEGYDLPLSEGELLEARLFQTVFESTDKKEGLAAFLEKRPPNFQ